jgi:predicted phage terminase large subunit-like protein
MAEKVKPKYDDAYFKALPPELLGALSDLDLIDRAHGNGADAVYAFGEYVFGVKPAAHHKLWIERKLEHKRVAIVAPPESAKTTWAMILMAWSIGKKPYTTNAFVSATEGAAQDMADVVANCIKSNQKWAKVFPHVIPHPDKGWSRDGYEVKDTSDKEWDKRTAAKKDPTLLAGGVGSKRLNGIRISGRMECDDIHDRNSMYSDTVCQDTVNFLKDTLLPRVTAEGSLGIEQTRWNAKDSIAYVKGLKGYAVFEHPAIGADGESYWAEHWSLERLEERRAEIGEVMWELVYQGNDKAREGQVLKNSWLINFPVVMIKHEYERFFGIDFARRIQELVGTKTKDPDEFALAVLVNTNPVLVVESGICERLTMGDAEDEFFRMAAIYSPKVIGLEVNSSGADYYQNLLRRMGAKGLRYYIKPITSTTNKGARLTEMAADFQFGLIKVSDSADAFVSKFRDQWATFGNKNAHDDALDAVYFAREAASHLLPTETREAKLLRRESQAQAVNPMQAIDRIYYGV